MRFGIFFEMSTPRPFTGGIEEQVFHHALEQARLADELGFDWVWAVEHHFLEEYSHCSARRRWCWPRSPPRPSGCAWATARSCACPR